MKHFVHINQLFPSPGPSAKDRPQDWREVEVVGSPAIRREGPWGGPSVAEQSIQGEWRKNRAYNSKLDSLCDYQAAWLTERYRANRYEATLSRYRRAYALLRALWTQVAGDEDMAVYREWMELDANIWPYGEEEGR